MKTDWQSFVNKFVIILCGVGIVYVFCAGMLGAGQYATKYHEVLGRIDGIEEQYSKDVEKFNARLVAAENHKHWFWPF